MGFAHLLNPPKVAVPSGRVCRPLDGEEPRAQPKAMPAPSAALLEAARVAREAQNIERKAQREAAVQAKRESMRVARERRTAKRKERELARKEAKRAAREAARAEERATRQAARKAEREKALLLCARRSELKVALSEVDGRHQVARLKVAEAKQQRRAALDALLAATRALRQAYQALAGIKNEAAVLKGVMRAGRIIESPAPVHWTRERVAFLSVLKAGPLDWNQLVAAYGGTVSSMKGQLRLLYRHELISVSGNRRSYQYELTQLGREWLTWAEERG